MKHRMFFFNFACIQIFCCLYFFFTSNGLSLGGREIFSLSHLKLNSRRILKWSRIETRVYLFMLPAFRSSHIISISPFSLSFKWKTMSGKHNSQYFCFVIRLRTSFTTTRHAKHWCQRGGAYLSLQGRSLCHHPSMYIYVNLIFSPYL